MKLYSENEHYKLYQGNMLDMLEIIEPNSIDSIITDPPYELNFMGKGWDNSGIAFQLNTWKKCYEVLKPGGYLLAFGGSRTFHRIACAIEDAGFEIRDTIMWLYGSGFPKSMDISKAFDRKEGNKRKIIGYTKNAGIAKDAEPDSSGSHIWTGNITSNEAIGYLAKKWQGWGTALKPSFEPIIVARKPFKGSLVDNVIKYGVGGINIDECRVTFNGDKWKSQKSGSTAKAFNLNEQQREAGTGILAGYECEANDNGRFPANTILTYDETDFEEVCSGFPYSKGASYQNNYSNGHIYRGQSLQESKTSLNGYREWYNDNGSASRYFYCAKASKKDRDEGCQDLEDTVNACSNQAIAELKRGNDNFSDETNSTFNKVYKGKNTHPTVKPTELMQYLVRLVSPDGATILDPFNGSGSTGKAVMYENKERNKNYKYIGIELTPEYLPIAKARIEYAMQNNNEDGQLTIYDFIGDIIN